MGMNIMILADQESKALYEYYDPERLQDIDLIISCGDLSAEYLSFLATVFHGPVLYVKGNHDTRYETKPPEGCICIEDQIYVYRGIRILGLGGSMQYIPGGANQYTERQMRNRVRRLRWKLWLRGGFDILVSHAPAYGLNDMKDLPHQGFKAFLFLMKKYKPRYFFHGHIHATYGNEFCRKAAYEQTTVINGYEAYIVSYENQ